MSSKNSSQKCRVAFTFDLTVNLTLVDIVHFLFGFFISFTHCFTRTQTHVWTYESMRRKNTHTDKHAHTHTRIPLHDGVFIPRMPCAEHAVPCHFAVIFFLVLRLEVVASRLLANPSASMRLDVKEKRADNPFAAQKQTCVGDACTYSTSHGAISWLRVCVFDTVRTRILYGRYKGCASFIHNVSFGCCCCC